LAQLGKTGGAPPAEEKGKRFTSFYKADLRGAQMDRKLREFARRQGAILS
jgi:serine/threonine-protein kinase